MYILMFEKIQIISFCMIQKTDRHSVGFSLILIMSCKLNFPVFFEEDKYELL